VAGGAGYSATPLARKLGLKPDHRLLIVNAPPGWAVPDLPVGVTARRVRRLSPRSQSDVILLFVRQAVELAEMPAAGEMIFPDGALWVAWPRKAAGHLSDVAENDIRDAALPLGLVDVKVAALDHDWSGLKVVWRKELRRRD
jgi:hypothetical protein